MHYVTFPHMHSCVILADCARDAVQHGAHLHTHYIHITLYLLAISGQGRGSQGLWFRGPIASPLPSPGPDLQGGTYQSACVSICVCINLRVSIFAQDMHGSLLGRKLLPASPGIGIIACFEMESTRQDTRQHTHARLRWARLVSRGSIPALDVCTCIEGGIPALGITGMRACIEGGTCSTPALGMRTCTRPCPFSNATSCPVVVLQLSCSCQSCGTNRVVPIVRYQSCGTNRAVPIVRTSTNAPAPSSLSFSSSRSARPVRSPSVATRVARTRTASPVQLPQLPVLSQLSQVDQPNPNPATLQGLKVWESLKKIAYPTLYPVTVRLFLVFSTGRRMFEPEL